MPTRTVFTGLLLLALTAAAGCAHQRPVLYTRGGGAAPGAAVAIDACMAQAQAAGLDYEDGAIAKRTVRGGVIGGAGGAAVGAVVGDVGRGAAVGAAYGATTGFFRGLFARESPDPVYRNYVNRCLRDRGYDPIGWD